MGKNHPLRQLNKARNHIQLGLTWGNRQAIFDWRRIIKNDNVYSCTWDEFENWIRQQIKGEFSWKIRPIGSKKSREIIVESIEMMIKNNDGSFPDSGDMFIEKITGQK